MGDRIHNVAVIGAGVSGVVSALHLEDAGLRVTVYERSSSAGGIWCVHDMNSISLFRPPLFFGGGMFFENTFQGVR